MRSETRSDSRLFGDLLHSLLKEGISVRFRANGRSMHPAIADGEVVQVDPREPRIGDTALVETADGLRLHRVLQVGHRARTRGDCCFDDDAGVTVTSKVSVVREGATHQVPQQTIGSIVRRWIARWRGRF